MSNTTKRLSLVMASVFTAFTMMSAAVPALGVAKKKVTKKATKKVVAKKVTVKKVTVNPDVANYNKALAAVKVAEGAFKYDMTNPDNIAYVKVKADLAQTAIENIIDSAKQAYLGTRLSVVENKIATVENNYAAAQAAKAAESAATSETAKAVVSATALNNTTMVVKFASAQSIAAAADYTFDNGLTVTQAAVKQDDATSVVLTTSSQDSTKTYKLSYKGTDTGLTVTGMAVATTPSAIAMTTSASMGTLGVNETVTATVTPASAGVPVTFNIICDDSTKATINTAIVKEVLTDAKGVATLTYTRYYGAQDDLSVYPTGSPAIRATSNVYWGSASRLTCTVTSSSATTSNSGAVIYKVTYLDSTGSALQNKKINVMFKENINASGSTATALPLSQGQALANGNLYQRDQIDNANALELVTDSNGIATFQITGSNTVATPIIYTDESTTNGSSNNNYTGATGGTYTDGNFDEYTKLKTSFLQITAPVATFSAGTYTITADQTTGNTITGVTNTDNQDDYGTTYTLTVKKSDGTAYANGYVSIGLQELMNGSGSGIQIAGVTNNSAMSIWQTPVWASGSTNVAYVQLNSNGQVEFNVTGTTANKLATPVIWIDSNNNNQVDNGESQYVAATSLFVTPTANGIGIHGYDSTGNGGATQDKITTQSFSSDMFLSAYVTDQSGNTFPMVSTSNEIVTLTLQNTGNHPFYIEPSGTAGDNIARMTVNGSTITSAYSVPVNTTATVVINSTNGASKTYLRLQSSDATTINVGATVEDVNDAKYYSTSNYALTFVNPDQVPNAGVATYTGTVKAFITGSSTTGDWLMLQQDGSGNYVTLNYMKNDSYEVGTDFTNQSFITAQTFTEDLSVGDRIQVTAYDGTLGRTGAAGLSTVIWKLVNVDGSSDSSVNYPGGTATPSATFAGTAANSGSPVIPYSAGTTTTPASAGKTVWTITSDVAGTAGSAGTGPTLTITINGIAATTTHIATTGTVATDLAAIDAAVNGLGFGSICTDDGTDKITITSPTTGTSSTATLATTAGSAGSYTSGGNAATAGLAAITSPAGKAVWEYNVTAQATDNDMVTVAIGSVTVTLTASTAANAAATPASYFDNHTTASPTGNAAAIATALNANTSFNATYTASNSGANLIITQNTAAATTATLSVSASH